MIDFLTWLEGRNDYAQTGMPWYAKEKKLAMPQSPIKSNSISTGDLLRSVPEVVRQRYHDMVDPMRDAERSEYQKAYNKAHATLRPWEMAANNSWKQNASPEESTQADQILSTLMQMSQNGEEMLYVRGGKVASLTDQHNRIKYRCEQKNDPDQKRAAQIQADQQSDYYRLKQQNTDESVASGGLA